MSREKLSTVGGDKAVTIRMPDSVHKALEQKALEDRRSLNSEVVWLVEAYASGELIAIGKLTAILARYEDRYGKGVPVFGGEHAELVSEGKPEQAYPHKKEGPHRQK